MLEEHWARHPELKGCPIYQASGVAKKALSVFQTYVGMMNADIQRAVQVRVGVCCGVGVCVCGGWHWVQDVQCTGAQSCVAGGKVLVIRWLGTYKVPADA